MKLGTVRVRVGLSYDPLRLSPGFGDLYTANCAGMFLKQKYCHAPPHPPNKTINPQSTQYQTNPPPSKTPLNLLAGLAMQALGVLSTTITHFHFHNQHHCSILQPYPSPILGLLLNQVTRPITLFIKRHVLRHSPHIPSTLLLPTQFYYS